MDLDLAQLSAFLAVVEERHVGRAARRLHLTPSAVSKRVHGLEDRLGVSLLGRDRAGGMALTGAGERFLAPAALVLEQAAAAARAARTEDSTRVVRVGYPAGTETVFPHLGLPGAARALREECPGARLVVVPVRFGDINRVLGEHRVDVMVTDCTMRCPGVESEPLPLTQARIALVPARHPLAGAGTVEAEELAAYPLAHNPRAPAEWMEPFWLADVRPRRDARLVPIGEDGNAEVVRHRMPGDGVLLNLTSVVPVLPLHLQVLGISGAADVRIHAAYRADDRRATLVPVLAALRRSSPVTAR